ncbi:MAG: hypothetical protein D3905_07115 [Candidatus Electrothrix sp. AS4_5]|nr:hypothetical protein [Candidatus Electrothrix gigas]
MTMLKNLHSIKQNDQEDVLPDFRNIGNILRILLIALSLTLAQTLFEITAWEQLQPLIYETMSLFAPILFCCLLLLWCINPLLQKVSFWFGVTLINGLTIIITAAIYLTGERLHWYLFGYL